MCRTQASRLPRVGENRVGAGRKRWIFDTSKSASGAICLSISATFTCLRRRAPQGSSSSLCSKLTAGEMVETFRALLVTKDDDRQSVAITELTDADLMEGNVTVAVEHSTVNYKDGLAITGKAPIIRKFPLIPGIDLAGRVLRSEDPRFQMGDRVVLNGYGLGEVHHGGYAERARVKGDWLILLPENISTANAMAIGTAGYTAMLCVWLWKMQASRRTTAMC